MSDYKVEVEQVISDDTEQIIPNESEEITMNTPEDSDTEIEPSKQFSSNNNENIENTENSKNTIRDVLDSTSENNVEYLSKTKFENILSEMRKDMLQVVNVAQIASAKSEQNERELNNIRRTLMGYENSLNVLRNQVRQLSSNAITHNNNNNFESINEETEISNDMEETEVNNSNDSKENYGGLTEITDSQSSKRAKVFKITPKRKLSSSRDVVGELVETKESTNNFTSKTFRKKSSSRVTSESERNTNLTPSEYRRNRRRR
jgi:hypothetical protein